MNILTLYLQSLKTESRLDQLHPSTNPAMGDIGFDQEIEDVEPGKIPFTPGGNDPHFDWSTPSLSVETETPSRSKTLPIESSTRIRSDLNYINGFHKCSLLHPFCDNLTAGYSELLKNIQSASLIFQST